MNYIVLDMEWNQPFNTKTMVKKPVTLHGEIVQIGAVKLNENYQIIDTFKIMVAPKYYTKMHKKVAKLTKITADELQLGFPFPVAFKHFKQWCGDSFTFLTWGSSDIEVLRNNMLLHKINTEWIPTTYYDVQIIFNYQIAKENHQVSLLSAMDKIGEPFLEAHDALNDARNTVSVCSHLNMNKGFSEYSEILKKQSSSHINNELTRSNSIKIYSTKEEALEDLELINFLCPFCNTKVVSKDFVRQNSNKYIGIAVCENNDELFVRLKFTKWSDKKLSVSRITYKLDEDKKNYYLKKKQRTENVKEN